MNDRDLPELLCPVCSSPPGTGPADCPECESYCDSIDFPAEWKRDHPLCYSPESCCRQLPSTSCPRQPACTE